MNGYAYIYEHALLFLLEASKVGRGPAHQKAADEHTAAIKSDIATRAPVVVEEHLPVEPTL